MPVNAAIQKFLEHALKALGDELQAIRSGPSIVAPGAPVTVSLLPLAAQLSVTSIVKENIQHKGQAKSQTAGDLTNTDGTLGTFTSNLVSTLTVPSPESAEPFLSLSPIPFQLPIKLSVSWSVTNFKGVPLPQDRYVALDSLTSPVASFVFLPEVTELTAQRPRVERYFIRPQVKLSVDPSFALRRVSENPEPSELISVPVSVPAVPVDVPELPLPRLVAFFRHTSYEAFGGPSGDDGFVLVCVPQNSVLRSVPQLQALLADLNALLEKVDAVPAKTTELLGKLEQFTALRTGLRQLLGVLSQPHSRLLVSSGLSNMDAFHMIKRTLLGIDPLSRDIRADNVSSMIVLGPPGTQVEIFRNTAMQPEVGNTKGHVTFTTGTECIVGIRNLSAPLATEPPGRLTVHSSPPGGTFIDHVASFRFGP